MDDNTTTTMDDDNWWWRRYNNQQEARMQENTTITNVVVVVHNNQIVGGLNLGRALTDGDWIGQEIDHTQTHNKEEEEATTDEVCGVGEKGDERPCNNQPHWAGQDIEGGERR